MDTPALRSKLATLPHMPGVYLMQDDTGKIIYVGAATDLKRRVSSYFHREITDRKTSKLVSNIKTFDYEIHESREAAFIRERELIRIHHPHYNIEWMDDKDYPLIQITIPSDIEVFSRLFVVRSPLNSHDWFFGRKKDVKALRSSVRLLRRIFPVANKSYCFRAKKPCLDYSIKRCSAPCVGKITKKDYQQIVDQFILFLQGKRKDLIENLYTEMSLQSENQNYEGAAKTRDRIMQLERTIESQKSMITQREKDIVFLIADNSYYILLNIWVNNGEIISSFEKNLGELHSISGPEIIQSYLQNFYLESDFIPPLIQIPLNLGDEVETLEIWLSKKQGSSIQIVTDPKLKDNKLIKHLILKSQFKLGERVRKEKKKQELQKNALKELQEYLKLEKLPERIETYDISNLQGKLPVGSMVVFKEGSPYKSQYRKFEIKTLPAEPNDVAMMVDIMTRRLKHEDSKFSERLPDLIVIDGGKPQVNAIAKVVSASKKIIPVIGLAKREEEVFLPNKRLPVPFPKESAALRLLKQTRDEAHRFAITYHKNRRRLQQKSHLDNIPGIGVKRRNSLLAYFGTVDKIKNATIEELCQVEGISRSVAEKVYLFLQSNPNRVN
jgi:excinuclease ABC subunit C